MRAVEIRPGTLRDITFIAAQMRAQDWREVHASSPLDDKAEAGALCYLASRWSYTAWWKGQPICAFGASVSSLPWLGSLWAFGTNDLIRAAIAVGRHCHSLRDEFISAGLRRLEVRSIIDHDLAHRWLKALGAKREAELIDFGRNGETFVLWSWTLTENGK